MRIRLAGIIKESIVDGPGIRYVIFTQGCYHNCYKCHNPKTHDINGGYLKEIDEIISDIKSSPYLSGITISGGEPFLQIDECFELLKSLDTDIDVIMYTGFTYEELIKTVKTNEKLDFILSRINYLIDGKFNYRLRDLELNFRGSSNQRIIDIKKTNLEKRLILVC